MNLISKRLGGNEYRVLYQCGSFLQIFVVVCSFLYLNDVLAVYVGKYKSVSLTLVEWRIEKLGNCTCLREVIEFENYPYLLELVSKICLFTNFKSNGLETLF